MWHTFCYLCGTDIYIEKYDDLLCDLCYDKLDDEDEKIKNADLENHFTKFNPR